jgi:hypothetical protein
MCKHWAALGRVTSLLRWLEMGSFPLASFSAAGC